VLFVCRGHVSSPHKGEDTIGAGTVFVKDILVCATVSVRGSSLIFISASGSWAVALPDGISVPHKGDDEGVVWGPVSVKDILGSHAEPLLIALLLLAMSEGSTTRWEATSLDCFGHSMLSIPHKGVNGSVVAVPVFVKDNLGAA
jgi:hypothetical protein